MCTALFERNKSHHPVICSRSSVPGGGSDASFHGTSLKEPFIAHCDVPYSNAHIFEFVADSAASVVLMLPYLKSCEELSVLLQLLKSHFGYESFKSPWQQAEKSLTLFLTIFVFPRRPLL